MVLRWQYQSSNACRPGVVDLQAVSLGLDWGRAGQSPGDGGGSGGCPLCMAVGCGGAPAEAPGGSGNVRRRRQLLLCLPLLLRLLLAEVVAGDAGRVPLRLPRRLQRRGGRLPERALLRRRRMLLLPWGRPRMHRRRGQRRRRLPLCLLSPMPQRHNFKLGSERRLATELLLSELSAVSPHRPTPEHTSCRRHFPDFTASVDSIICAQQQASVLCTPTFADSHRGTLITYQTLITHQSCTLITHQTWAQLRCGSGTCRWKGS